MRQTAWAAGVLALLTASILPSRGDDAETLTIKEVMTKAHKPKGLLPAMRKELNADPIDWVAIQKQSKELTTLAKALEKAEPTKGDKDSWAKFTKSYANNAEALNASAEKEDRAGARSAMAKLGGSCMACHRAHRGRS
jgi:cytochrome c556